MKVFIGTAISLSLSAAAVAAAEVTATVHDRDGKRLGAVIIQDLPSGGHVAGDRKHGVMVDGGPHPGDMPNLTVKSNGVGEIEVFMPFLSVQNDLLDSDGSAFVMHQGLDDYESQPAGDAGDRIACGELTERTQ